MENLYINGFARSLVGEQMGDGEGERRTDRGAVCVNEQNHH